MSEIVDRVARAMCDTKLWPGAWKRETEGNREEWRMLACAAIEAMREPTDAMLQAGPPEPYMDRYVWGKIIDAALEKGK
jgi:hypothetical protein